MAGGETLSITLTKGMVGHFSHNLYIQTTNFICGTVFFILSFSHNYFFFTCIVCVRPIVKGVGCPGIVKV